MNVLKLYCHQLSFHKGLKRCILLLWSYYFSWNTALDKKSSHGDRIICMALISIWMARLRMRICAWSLIRLIKSSSTYVRRRHLNKMQALRGTEADVQYKSTLVSLFLKMWSNTFFFILWVEFSSKGNTFYFSLPESGGILCALPCLSPTVSSEA